jgi:hypothetical protein
MGFLSVPRVFGLMFLGGAFLSACGGGDAPEEPMGPPPEPVLVNAPDDVVESLRDAWNQHDYAALVEVLSDDFVFYVSPADADSAGVPLTWDRETELTATLHLFEGETGVGPDGTPQPPVDARFTFGLTMNPEDDWTMRDDPPFDGMVAREYVNTMTVQYENFDLNFIAGSQVFFVAEEDGTNEQGDAILVYRLKAWRDLGQTIPAYRHQAFTWGFLKALYRDIYVPPDSVRGSLRSSLDRRTECVHCFPLSRPFSAEERRSLA